jgi:hypothetical protein
VTVDRETRHGEGEQDEQEADTSGFVYVDWQPTEGAKDHSQRVDDVQRVEVLPPEDPEGYDDGELVLHTEDGTCVFDRTGMRGFRTKGAVDVPEYEQRDDGDDSATRGGEQ